MPGKTYVACRPGMQRQMQSAFAGLDVVVDDHLTVDYEFRERQMTLEEIMEEETVKAEKVDLDPRGAHTLVVPLSDNLDNPHLLSFVVIRAANKSASRYEVQEVIKTVPMHFDMDGELDGNAVMSDLKAALKKAGIEVHSVSYAEGLSWMKV